MSPSPREYIWHIIDEIDFVLSAVTGTDFESFLGDETLKRAFVRSLEIIGEAAKRIPEDLRRRQPTVEWRKRESKKTSILLENPAASSVLIFEQGVLGVFAALREIPLTLTGEPPHPRGPNT